MTRLPARADPTRWSTRLPRGALAILAGALALSACSQSESGTAPPLAPSLAEGGVGRPVVLVNPNANGNGTASTIQEGIDMVAPGGRVQVLPGTYIEAIIIDKGVVLEGIAAGSAPVVIAPAGAPDTAVRITTGDPVTIRDLSVRFSGKNGIAASGAMDLTIERVALTAVNPPLGIGHVIYLGNNSSISGARARLVVSGSTVDGSITDRAPPFAQNFGIQAGGDVDAWIEGNIVRRTGGACIWIVMRNDLAGETNADVVNNDLDECHPLGRAGALIVGPGLPLPNPVPLVTATGVVNVVGNTIRNSAASCLTVTGISYEYFAGRIEHNSIENVVEPCAVANPRNLPGAIWVGSRLGLPQATPIVRFNDIVGNAIAGLHVGANQGIPIDATCNWWGSLTGPSGIGSGSGDAIVIEPGAAAPSFEPFATGPIARTPQSSC